MSHLTLIVVMTTAVVLSSSSKGAFAAGHKSSKDKYLAGYYFDKRGVKIEGLIAKDELTFQFFSFKKELGDTAIQIEADQCDSFCVGNRVFHAISDVSIKAIVWRTHMDKAFAELVTDGPVQLYCIRFQPGKVGYMRYVSIASNFTGGAAGQVVGAMAGRQNANYFVRRQEGGDYTRIEKGTFTEKMTEYLKDDPTVVQKLTANPDYSINNIELVVREYNQDKG